MDATGAWLSFAYHYVVGTVIFMFGMVLARRQGVIGLATRSQRITTLLISGGYLLAFLMHLAVMLAAEAARVGS